MAGITAGLIGHFVVMFFVGLYLSFNPDLYVRCAVRLFPPNRREQIRDALQAAGRRYGAGSSELAALPSAESDRSAPGFRRCPTSLALGVVAGLLDSFPSSGPVLAIVPGVLLALSQSPQMALYAGIVYISVQQLENHIIVPLTQRWSVALPPAVAVLSLVGMGLLFGLLGVLFAMPLTVVTVVLLKKLYVEGGLEKHS